MSLEPSVFSLRGLCETCLEGLAPRARADGRDLLALVYDDVPDLLLGDPQALGMALTQRLVQALDQGTDGALVLRVELELHLGDRCRLRFRPSPAPAGADLDLVVELPLAQGPAPGSPAADLEGVSVALLDPHPLAALALGHRLRQAGALVDRFETREALLDVLRGPGPLPDLLLLGLPADTAPQGVRDWLAACGGTPALPVLVMLSGAQAGLAEAAGQAGAKACLVRPFRLETLAAALEKLLPSPARLDSPQDRVRALEIVGGDQGLADELLETLTETLATDLAAMEALVGAKDWQGARALAHRLRGAAGYCALPELSAAAEALEQATAERSPAVHTRLQALEREAERVLAYCARRDP